MMNEKMMDARRRDRELIGLRGVPEAWSKSPTQIEQFVFLIEQIFDNIFICVNYQRFLGT